MNQPIQPIQPLAPFEPGQKITGTATIGEREGDRVTGQYLGPYGADGCCGILILSKDGIRIPVSADSAEVAVPTLASSLRQLAALVDQHPEIADWYQFPSLNEHQSGVAEAPNLDAFAAVFGVDIQHKKPHDNGDQYSTIETNVGVLALRLQCDTADYRAATGESDATQP